MFVRQFLQGFVQFFMQFVKKCILDGRKFRGRKLLEIFVGSVFSPYYALERSLKNFLVFFL